MPQLIRIEPQNQRTGQCTSLSATAFGAPTDRRRAKWVGQDALVRQVVLANLLRVPRNSINPDDVARKLAGGDHPSPEESLKAAQLCDPQLDAEIAAGRSVTVELVLSSEKLKRASKQRRQLASPSR